MALLDTKEMFDLDDQLADFQESLGNGGEKTGAATLSNDGRPVLMWTSFPLGFFRTWTWLQS